MKKVVVKKNRYVDSVSLMGVSEKHKSRLHCASILQKCT